MVPDAAKVQRFAADLDALIAPAERIGVAVSGGPDSLALLLLASAARPGKVEATSVDHALRPGSREESENVGRVCERLGVPHRLLTVQWAEQPRSAIQERGREERYRLLGRWATERDLSAIATAHHVEDQAETLIMRLLRGAGVRGLAAIRAAASVPGTDVRLLRPLLAWRRSELAEICAAAGIEAAHDPSNLDDRFERVRVRRALFEADWLDPHSLASSAAHLAEADAALDWAMRQEWQSAVTNGGAEIAYRPSDAPLEIRRRIVQAAVARLASEGDGANLRGRELDRLLAVLGGGGQATIRGVRCAGGEAWRFSKAPSRKV